MFMHLSFDQGTIYILQYAQKLIKWYNKYVTSCSTICIANICNNHNYFPLITLPTYIIVNWDTVHILVMPEELQTGSMWNFTIYIYRRRLTSFIVTPNLSPVLLLLFQIPISFWPLQVSPETSPIPSQVIYLDIINLNVSPETVLHILQQHCYSDAFDTQGDHSWMLVMLQEVRP